MTGEFQEQQLMVNPVVSHKRYRILPQLLGMFTAKFGPVHKVTERDDFIAYTFNLADATSKYQAEITEQIKLYISMYGTACDGEFFAHDDFGISTPTSSKYKSMPRQDLIRGMASGGGLKHFISVKYDYVTDTLRVQRFETGWTYSHRKQRFYPRNKNIPVMCYNTNLWIFKKGKPRLLHGLPGDCESYQLLRDILPITLSCDPEILEFKVKWSHLLGEHDKWNALRKQYGVMIPKALRELERAEINKLLKVIEPNDMNKLCQVIADRKKKSAQVTPNGPKLTAYEVQRAYGNNSLASLVVDALKLGGTTPEELVNRMYSLRMDHIVNDWIIDHMALGMKISLKITSQKRIEDEHRKLSRIRMLKQLGPIKVHEKYAMLEKSPEFEGLEKWLLIKDRKRLLEESDDMDHCVATYGTKINSGECAIVSITYQGQRYTAEMAFTRPYDPVSFRPGNIQLRVVQLQGVRNSGSPSELRVGLEHYIAVLAKAIADKQVEEAQRQLAKAS